MMLSDISLTDAVIPRSPAGRPGAAVPGHGVARVVDDPVGTDLRRAGNVSGCRTTGMAGSSGTRGRCVAGRLHGDDGAGGLPAAEGGERIGDIGQGVEVGREWLGADRARGQ